MISYNDLIGLPFDEHGDCVNNINCYDLMRMAHARHGLIVPETNISVCASKEVSNKTITRGIEKDWQRIDNPIVPCGVLILSIHMAFANHIATYIGNNLILHISKNTNSLIERLYPKYQNRVVGFYKFIGGQQ